MDAQLVKPALRQLVVHFSVRDEVQELGEMGAYDDTGDVVSELYSDSASGEPPVEQSLAEAVTLTEGEDIGAIKFDDVLKEVMEDFDRWNAGRTEAIMVSIASVITQFCEDMTLTEEDDDDDDDAGADDDR